jgi:hypothetical protein
MLRAKYLAFLVLVFGIVILVAGAVFIGLGIQKNNFITSALKDQQITLGLSPSQIAQGQVVDNAAEAQVASNLLNQHLKSIAPTYGALMAKNTATGGKYDPTNPTNLTYTQGLNMENSMNIVVLGYGVIQETLALGGVLIVIGLLAGTIGLSILKLAEKEKELEERPAKARAAVLQT